VVEGNLGNGAIGIDIPVQIGLSHILQGIFIGFLFQQIGFVGNL
jgi:hypothetical protein